MLSFVCKDRIKGKISLLSKGEDKIKQRLDIENIIKTFRDIEKIKILLLDKDQLLLFDHLPNPMLTAKDNMNTIQDERHYLKLFYPNLKDSELNESTNSLTNTGKKKSYLAKFI